LSYGPLRCAHVSKGPAPCLYYRRGRPYVNLSTRTDTPQPPPWSR